MLARAGAGRRTAISRFSPIDMGVGFSNEHAARTFRAISWRMDIGRSAHRRRPRGEPAGLDAAAPTTAGRGDASPARPHRRRVPSTSPRAAAGVDKRAAHPDCTAFSPRARSGDRLVAACQRRGWQFRDASHCRIQRCGLRRASRAPLTRYAAQATRSVSPPREILDRIEGRASPADVDLGYDSWFGKAHESLARVFPRRR